MAGFGSLVLVCVLRGSLAAGSSLLVRLVECCSSLVVPRRVGR